MKYISALRRYTTRGPGRTRLKAPAARLYKPEGRARLALTTLLFFGLRARVCQVAALNYRAGPRILPSYRRAAILIPESVRICEGFSGGELLLDVGV